MRNRRSPEKPTTSASTRSDSSCTTMTCEPSGSFSPTASITKPATRVRRPRTSIGWAAAAIAADWAKKRLKDGDVFIDWRSALARLLGRCIRNRLFEVAGAVGRTQGGQYTLPARPQRCVDLALRGFDAAATARDACVGNEAATFEQSVGFEFCAQQRKVLRIDEDSRMRMLIDDHRHRFARNGQQRIAPHDLARDGECEIEQRVGTVVLELAKAGAKLIDQ